MKNTIKEPGERYSIPRAAERVEEFAPGLDPELQAKANALTEYKDKMTKSSTKKWK